MQNANIGLVDITLTCHFEVKDTEVFGGAGSVGYTSVALKHAKAADQLVGIINNSVQCEGFLYREDVWVVPESVGGDTSGVQIPFTVYNAGNRVKGTFDLTTKTFTADTNAAG